MLKLFNLFVKITIPHVYDILTVFDTCWVVFRKGKSFFEISIIALYYNATKTKDILLKDIYERTMQ